VTVIGCVILVADDLLQVYWLTMARQGAQRTVFGMRQNRALRTGLRAVRRDRKLSQVAIGQLLGMTQQNVARLLNSDDAGFSYEAATRLVQALGHAGVDAFFLAKGLRTETPDARA
jgi:hypothetical protein